MNTSGEAADQVVRMMLEGSEVLIRLTGTGAKNAAVLLYAALKGQQQTRGQARLSAMLQSGKPLKVFSFRKEDLETFKDSAKHYGILYTVLKEKDDKDGLFDVLVRAEDESKMLRIIERFKLVGVDVAAVRAELQKEKEKELAAKKDHADAAKEDGGTGNGAGEQSGSEKEEPVKAQPTAERNHAQFEAVMASNRSEPANPPEARTESRSTPLKEEGRALPSRGEKSPLSTAQAEAETPIPGSASPSEPRFNSGRNSNGRISVIAEIERKKAERAAAAKQAPVKMPEIRIPARKEER